MSEMNEEVLDEAMESSTEENVSETKEDENVTSTEETAETAEILPNLRCRHTQPPAQFPRGSADLSVSFQFAQKPIIAGQPPHDRRRCIIFLCQTNRSPINRFPFCKPVLTPSALPDAR